MQTQTQPPPAPRRTLYPELAPYNTGRLRVDALHELYYEESGNPHGKPVVFLHGGPGGGSEPRQRRFFDPTHYRIVLFDQRGCGRSTPHAELRDNTTWHLVQDIEALRTHLAIERWQVFGGSWGSSLALAYAQTHPAQVTELVLRGIFLLRQWEIDWFYQEGTSRLFPDVWQHFVAAIPDAERHDFVTAYYNRLTGADKTEQLKAARAWSIWEGSTSYLQSDVASIERFADAAFALPFARIECHYFKNKGFFTHDGQLLTDVAKMRHIPGVIVQGRYDVICPAQNAWDLHRAWPQSRLHLVPDAGHASWEPGTVHALVEATDAYRTL